MWFPEIISPQDHLEIILEDWAHGVRGDEPTPEEWRSFLLWLFDDEAWDVEEPRPFQMFIRWFDRTLPDPDQMPGKVARVRGDEDLDLRDLEKLAKAADATYEDGTRKWSILDLWIEERCARRGLQLSVEMQSRWRELRLVLMDGEILEFTYEYLQEAASCFLYGQYRGCVSLCRSTIELVLKESLGYPPGAEHTIQELIRLARKERLLVGKHYKFAERVRERGNRVIHPREVVDREAAKEVLALTGYVVEALAH